MALTSAQIKDAARQLGRDMFPAGVTGNLNLDDLDAAIGSLDVAMGTVINAVPVAWLTKTIEQALLDNLPDPFQSRTTVRQRELALSIWTSKAAGVI